MFLRREVELDLGNDPGSSSSSPPSSFSAQSCIGPRRGGALKRLALSRSIASCSTVSFESTLAGRSQSAVVQVVERRSSESKRTGAR